MLILKPIRKQFQKMFRATRKYVAANSPEFVKKHFGPTFDYLDMLFIDHGIFRVVYFNKHQIADGVWRASQPAPHQIRSLAKQGFKTIINLRGPRECGSYRLEQRYCEKYGLKLIDFKMYSREAPAAQRVKEAEQLFNEIEYPVLFHCKSGADRAGIASALHVLLHQNQPVEEAQKQLSLKFGHFRQADTGVLDYFFDKYVEARQASNISFYDWLETDYNPKELKAEFRTIGAMNVFVNRILRRE